MDAIAHPSLIPEGKKHTHHYCSLNGGDDFCYHCGKLREELERKKGKKCPRCNHGIVIVPET